MKDKHKLIEQILKNLNLKKTHARFCVLETLFDIRKPMTYDEVFNELFRKKVEVNISTVYRILEVLSDRGVLSKLTVGENSRTLYEIKNSEHSHYLYCVNCKDMYKINECPVNYLIDKIKDKMQFEVLDHKIELSGVCKDCKNM